MAATHKQYFTEHPFLYGNFQKWWYPTTMGFPTKNDDFGVFWVYHYFWKPPYLCVVTIEILGVQYIVYYSWQFQPLEKTLVKLDHSPK